MGSLKINAYFMDQPGDSAWVRIRNRLSRRPIPVFPRTIQIQTFTGCNADCIFCPYGLTYETQSKGKMAPELFRRIIDEASAFPVRRISPYLMNEPLMDRDLFDKIRYVNATIPDCKVVIASNGHFLTPPMVDRILEMEDGLHEISISLQGIERESYEKTMRGNMSFDRTLANVDHFIETQRSRGLSRPKLWITMVDTAVIDARAAVAYWRSRGVASRYTTLENGGGNIERAESISRTGSMSYYTTCTRLFKQAYILWNGDVVLCCVDYARQQVLGNVTNSSLYDVWNGPVAAEIRRRYLGGEFDRLPLCGRCKIDEIREVAYDIDGRERRGSAAEETNP